MMNILNEFSMDFFSLKDKVAIVTGGNTGLGQAYSVAFAKAGANLFIITYDKNWEETKNLIEAEGRKVEFYQADLTDREQIRKSIETCKKIYGKIDILVNNAGTIKRHLLLEYPDSDWKAVLDINLNTVYYMSQDNGRARIW